MASADELLHPEERRATNTRFAIVAVTAIAAVLLYLHRFSMSYAQQFIQEDLGITDDQMAFCLGAFFFSYALGQVPSGWLGDRFGGRICLTLYILIWSAFTVSMGFTIGFVMLLVSRLGMGLGQAGAYPTSAAVLSKWVPLSFRGTASSLVAFGGRVGGAIAPLVTGYMILWFVPISVDPSIKPTDILDPQLLAEQLQQIPEELTEPIHHARQHVLEQVKAEHPDTPDSAAFPADPHVLAPLLNRLLVSRSLPVEEAFVGLPLDVEAKSLLNENAESSLSEQKLTRLNRLLLEAVFPKGVRKLYGQGWRPTMITLGSLGLFVAALFFLIHRNRPDQHPWCNEAEIRKIEAGRPKRSSSPDAKVGAVPLKPLLKSRSIWLLCFSQFGTNIGWVFLVTLLPKYLTEVHDVSYEQRLRMVTVPLLAGWVGMFAGGWTTDFLARRMSLRWSRSLPIAATRFLAMTAYLLCLLDLSPWTVTFLFAVVAFSTDCGSAPSWAFNQDVGGQYVGSVLGWGNMWGNLGAAISPSLIQRIASIGGWDAAFIACAAAFAFAGICSLGADATKPVVEET